MDNLLTCQAVPTSKSKKKRNKKKGAGGAANNVDSEAPLNGNQERPDGEEEDGDEDSV